MSTIAPADLAAQERLDRVAKSPAKRAPHTSDAVKEARARVKAKYSPEQWATLMADKEARRFERERCRRIACQRTMDDGEPVWRLRWSLPGFIATYRSLNATVCGQCIAAASRTGLYQYRRFIVRASEPCGCCGRLVHDVAGYSAWPRYYCCENCRRKGESARKAALGRARRAEVRGPSRECGVCGEAFETKRANAQFCSGLCRQKAYRRRAALRLSFPGHSQGNGKRNAITADHPQQAEGLS